MRTTPDQSPDTLPTLGSPIKPAAAPAPAPAPVAPGIVRKPDGTLHTDLPEPSWAAPSCLAVKPAAPISDAEASGWDLGHFGPGCTACGEALMTFCAVSMCGNLDCRGYLERAQLSL